MSSHWPTCQIAGAASVVGMQKALVRAPWCFAAKNICRSQAKKAQRHRVKNKTYKNGIDCEREQREDEMNDPR